MFVFTAIAATSLVALITLDILSEIWLQQLSTPDRKDAQLGPNEIENGDKLFVRREQVIQKEPRNVFPG